MSSSSPSPSSSSSSSRSLSASAFARGDAPQPAQRVGHGFDLHRLEPGLPLILGGVTIDHDRGCAAHSDGDAVYHTVTDAVLGALTLPDIGQLFPDKDPQWKGATSDVFMRAACDKMVERGYRVSNLDVTVILERPKLAPYKERIRQNVAELLRVPVEFVNLKAKTHERVDSLGENRSVGCHAVVLLERVDEAADAQLAQSVRRLAQSGAARANEVLSSLSLSSSSGATAAPRATAADVLHRVYATVASRREADPSSSWTAKLFAKGRDKIAQKVGEEAVEVVIDAARDRRERVVSESADLLYHLMVLWADMGVQPEEVWAELAARQGTSGIAEKASRSTST